MYGIRTIAGLGTWAGWITSYEYDKAIDLGYKIEILKGYSFARKIIFKEYVDKLYQLRLEYTKDNPMNLIAKLLMNSLYGKFGMKSESNSVELFNMNSKSDSDKLTVILDDTGESIQDLLTVGSWYIV